jgi:MFS family permease
MAFLSPSRLAVKVIFFLNGFAHANYMARLPRIQEQFQIDNSLVGLTLLASSVGALFAMPFTGWLIIRNGSRKIGITSVIAYCCLVPFIPLMPSLAGLLFLFLLLGISAGMLDVSMNSQAVMVEQQLGKPIMTSFHALFSIGMMLGALAGSFFTKIGVGLFPHFAIISTLCLVPIFLSIKYLVNDKPEVKKTSEPLFRLPNTAMVSIGLIAFCSMLGEGTMADWSTNYLELIAKADPALAPIGLSAFALAMTIGRVLGDGARVKFGDRVLMILCGVISTTGLCFALIVNNPYLVIVGLFIVGLGLSVIVPIAYSIAGNSKDLPPGVGLAMVTTVGYSGFLFGPPIIGFLADWQNLRYALILVVVLFLLMTILSFLRKQKAGDLPRMPE